MNFRWVIILSFLVVLSGCINHKDEPKPTKDINSELIDVNQSAFADLSEYCFEFGKDISLSMMSVSQMPSQFLESNSKALAAINGPYYDNNGKTLGVAYLSEGNNLGNKQGRKSGYFFVTKDSSSVFVDEKMSGNFSDYSVVVGTHPLLVKDGLVSTQAEESRYNFSENSGVANLKEYYRSAIGTKTGKNVCFAVSNKVMSMSDWAQALLVGGYFGAVNLDGGPISQLAVRGKGVYGGGIMPTRLMIYAEKK